MTHETQPDCRDFSHRMRGVGMAIQRDHGRRDAYREISDETRGNGSGGKSLFLNGRGCRQRVEVSTQSLFSSI
jgi:hypothetical protein